MKCVLTLYDILGWIKRSSCLESEKGRSMNPLLTQKIEWGVRLKSDEIVGERKQPIPGKEVDGGGSGERETKRAHSSSLGRQMPQLSHGLTDTGTELMRSRPEHLRYFLSICTWFWSIHPPAIGKYYHYPNPRNKAIVAALRVRGTANGADVRFPRHVHLRWPEQVEICRTSR